MKLHAAPLIQTKVSKRPTGRPFSGHDIINHVSILASLSLAVLLDYNSLFQVTIGQKMRLWYGSDLNDNMEWDNAGRVCAEVYAQVDGGI